jgi:hypothetical protein
MRDLEDREAQNIFELEVNEMLAEKPFFKSLSEISPPPSPFQVSLGFPHRIPATPLYSG